MIYISVLCFVSNINFFKFFMRRRRRIFKRKRKYSKKKRFLKKRRSYKRFVRRVTRIINRSGEKKWI